MSDPSFIPAEIFTKLIEQVGSPEDLIELTKLVNRISPEIAKGVEAEVCCVYGVKCSDLH